MAVMCNRRGGINLKIVTETGFEVVKLTHGLNDVSDEKMSAAFRCLPEAMAAALTAPKPNGDPADLVQVDARPHTEELKAVDKAKMARAAETLEELRALAEGEDRQTVLDAIEKRSAQLLQE